LGAGLSFLLGLADGGAKAKSATGFI
jgi:hypothetical protein